MSLPDRYASWSGTLEELCAELSGAAADIGLDVELPSARGVRHYQSRGAVDRPARGRGAGYTGRHLLQTLATRALLEDGWTLARVPDVTQALSDLELYGFVRGDTALPRAADAEVEAHADAGKDPRARALAGVQALRAGADKISDPATRTVYAASATTKSARPAPTRHAAARTPRSAMRGQVGLSYTPCSWMSAHVDADRLATLSEREVDDALDQLSRDIKADHKSRKDDAS